MSTLIQERWEKVQGLSLKQGAHKPNSTFCVMEAVAFVAGEPWSDHPDCVCPVIGTFMLSWNDALPNDAARDRLLKPLIPKLIGTRKKSLEERRSLMAADWLVRTHTPTWLRLAGLDRQAELLESLPEITSMAPQIPSIIGPLEAVRKDASAARDAAWAAAAWPAAFAAAARDAASAAARDAAFAAAAWDAASAAASAAALAAAFAAAAWPAALDAAWAAARDAALAAAVTKLAPSVERLQSSAVQLVIRMIEAKP